MGAVMRFFSPARIRMDPLPGLAREEDILRIQVREDRHYELVDGVLVEKVVGSRESFLAGLICRLLGNYAEEHDLGDVTPGDGPYRLGEGIVRLPDVAFVPWSQLPGRMYPQDAIPGMRIPLWFQPEKTGTFQIFCAQLCGGGHAQMAGGR